MPDTFLYILIAGGLALAVGADICAVLLRSERQVAILRLFSTSTVVMAASGWAMILLSKTEGTDHNLLMYLLAGVLGALLYRVIVWRTLRLTRSLASLPHSVTNLVQALRGEQKTP